MQIYPFVLKSFHQSKLPIFAQMHKTCRLLYEGIVSFGMTNEKCLFRSGNHCRVCCHTIKPEILRINEFLYKYRLTFD